MIQKLNFPRVHFNNGMLYKYQNINSRKMTLTIKQALGTPCLVTHFCLYVSVSCYRIWQTSSGQNIPSQYCHIHLSHASFLSLSCSDHYIVPPTYTLIPPKFTYKCKRLTISICHCASFLSSQSETKCVVSGGLFNCSMILQVNGIPIKRHLVYYLYLTDKD